MAKAKKKAPGKTKVLVKKLAAKVEKIVEKAIARKPATKAVAKAPKTIAKAPKTIAKAPKATARPTPAKVPAKAKAPAKAAPAVKKPAKPAARASNGKSVASAPAPTRLAGGDSAPSFSLPDQNGNVVSSDSLEGKSYVIYFYPKDDTPGCTREACGFRDDLGKFRARGVEVIGVSPDGAASHTRFIDKYGLNFTLLSDEDKTLANAYGVWTKKQNYGREYMGIERSTFLVGSDGKIKKAWRSVKVDGHIPAVYEATS